MLITLHSNGYEVAVNTMGAELKSFKDPSGKEYVWNSDPAFWMRSSPLLFPTIGNLRNGETTMKGQVYPLVKHGFCKDTEFEVKDLSDDTVTFLLHANEETLKSYPYQFELSLTYHLSSPVPGFSPVPGLSVPETLPPTDTRVVLYDISFAFNGSLTAYDSSSTELSNVHLKSPPFMRP